ELLKGHLRLHEKIRDWDNFAARVKGFVSNVKVPRQVRRTPEEAQRRKRVERFGRFLGKLRGTSGTILLGTLSGALRALGAGEHVQTLMEPKARKAILDIIAHTMEHAPWMFPEFVAPLIVMHLRQVELLNHGRPLMLKQIEVEIAEGTKYEFAANSFVAS